MVKEKDDVFADYKSDSLTKPRDLCWDNWAKFEKVGDKYQGYIRDCFFRAADGLFKEQRGITLEQKDGTLINVGMKRLPFILNKTDDLRLGDPLTIELVELKKSSTKGFNSTKIFAYYGKNLPENEKNKTVAELDEEDRKRGGTIAPTDDAPANAGAEEDVPFD